MAKKITIDVTEYEALLNIETASKAIMVAQNKGICEHGITTEYPIHLWYCGSCWEYLQKTLLDYETEGE